ncbi:DnaA regulatory inactivator Hda [Marichromatium bheemlicum]|uniref:DnaA regulatory inactivator Hda n=1 Tax=Marichromatium bheemlicum TaxID=365339 RepID=A0ABX1I5W6_9GAMM|nr:DnaA regulatory inactivator Hda [Marichromatium bheemlicum]NKN32566.1 DnaA regulatory inactivator Hda [Marichromatium bheemlicum]
MTRPTPQLHLAIELEREPTLAEYLPGPNAEAVAAITRLARGDGEPFVFLCGAPGTGKTHLLQAACLEANARRALAHYLPLSTPGLAPSLLDDLERLDLIAIDDIDAVAADRDWESALFGLFNRLRERGRRLLAAARQPPERLALGLADLRSRLQWGPCYRLLGLSDRDCERLLATSATHRGLVLGPALVRYIMHYHARDPGSLLELIGRIDAASLREQRQPTIPMLRRLLREHA